MASSRKDKFKKAIQSHIEKNEGESPEKPGMQGFVEDMARNHRGEEGAETAPAGAPDEVSAASAPEQKTEQKPESPVPAAESSPVTPADPRPRSQPAAGSASPGSSGSPEKPDSEKEKPKREGAAVPSKMSEEPEENLISRPKVAAETVPGSSSRAAESRKPIMARTRDSVYNVSSDIRLEDYTESNPEGGGGVGAALRIGAGLVLLVVLLYGIYSAGTLLFAPSYTLAVSSTPLTAANAVEFAASERVSTAAGSPVYIHFQWEEGQLETDYVKIQIDRINAGGGEIEEAILARRPPITANYIQFAGPLEVGKYRITVTDRGGRRLADRVVTVN